MKIKEMFPVCEIRHIAGTVLSFRLLLAVLTPLLSINIKLLFGIPPVRKIKFYLMLLHDGIRTQQKHILLFLIYLSAMGKVLCPERLPSTFPCQSASRNKVIYLAY